MRVRQTDSPTVSVSTQNKLHTFSVLQIVMFKRIFLAALVLAAIAGADFLIRLRPAPRPESQKPGKFPEELVFVRSKDDVVSGGVVFKPPRSRQTNRHCLDSRMGRKLLPSKLYST